MMWDAHTHYVTVAQVSSESGDYFLKTFDGWLAEDEIKRMVFEEAPDWWDDIDYVYVEDSVHIRFMGYE